MMNIPNKKPGRAVKKTNTAFEGDTIQFSRKGVEADGIVTKVGENSVIVSLTDDLAEILEYITPFTVVGHANYTVIKPASIKA